MTRVGLRVRSGENDLGIGHDGLKTPESCVGDMIRLLVVDEHPVIGEGIRAILNDQPDFWVKR